MAVVSCGRPSPGRCRVRKPMHGPGSGAAEKHATEERTESHKVRTAVRTSRTVLGSSDVGFVLSCVYHVGLVYMICLWDL